MKITDLIAEATKRLKVDGRTKEGRRQKALILRAKERLNALQDRPMLFAGNDVYVLSDQDADTMAAASE